MKKTLIFIFALALSLVFIFTGCINEGDENTTNPIENGSGDSTTPADGEAIIVGASSTPHAEILEQIKAVLAQDGYTLDIVTYDDYVLPNEALADKTLDANYFQHAPYMNKFNEANNTDLHALALIHYEPFGIYGNELSELSELPEGANILVPADDSNQNRALFLLEQEGLITLAEDADPETGVSVLDIEDEGGYNIVAVQADMLAPQLKEGGNNTIAVINGNYAILANLDISDALAIEDASGDVAQTYANVIAVRSEDKDSPKLQALVSALQSQAVKDFIKTEYEGAVVAIFD